MKRNKLIGLFFSLAAVVCFFASCDDDDESLQTCEQAEICDAESVTACCDGATNTCVYQFNDKEYSEDQLDQLAVDLGCSNGQSGDNTGRVSSANEGVKEQLKNLMLKARSATNK